MYCVKCGKEYEGQFCPHCGQAAPVKRYCPGCGTEITDPNMTDCPSCGGFVPKSETPPPAVGQPSIIIQNTNTNTNTNTVPIMVAKTPKNKWVAFLLCLFLGYFGAHKFYEGRIGMGILYLFTMGLFGIGWLIDCIILLTKPNPYYV